MTWDISSKISVVEKHGMGWFQILFKKKLIQNNFSEMSFSFALKLNLKPTVGEIQLFMSKNHMFHQKKKPDFRVNT